MRILATQILPTSGEAFVMGFDVFRDGGKIRKVVGYVPQEVGVWGTSLATKTFDLF